MYKIGDRVVILPHYSKGTVRYVYGPGNYQTKVELDNYDYGINGFDYRSGRCHSYENERIILESVYNSPLYKLMEELE